MSDRVNITRPKGTPNRLRMMVWLIILAAAWLLWSRFAEIDTLLKTLRQGQPLWIGCALIMQVIYQIIFSGVYWSAFHTVAIRSRLIDLIPLTFASIFVNSTVTSGGAAGTLLFVDDARRRGESAPRATAGTLLVMAADYTAFAMLLTVGLIFLIRDHDLTKLEGISALAMYLLILGVLGLLSAGLWAPTLLQRVLATVQTAGTWIGRLLHSPHLFADDWAERMTEEFTAAADMMSQQPIRLARTVAIALLAHLVDLSSLWLLFWAFHQPVSLSMVIVLYAMTMLFWIVSPTPNGIGVVETVMPVIYASVGLSLEAGTIINLAFRGISFWFPLLVGFLLMRRLRLLTGAIQVLK
ncbi:MAG: lysylphosphatidylglycerol synthase transmembrane domain-containing protein [Caldilineaceae bacterium]